MYDIDAVGNANNFVEIFIAINSASGGLLGPILIMLIGIVLFAISRTMEEDFSKSMIYSGLLTSLIGILFVFAGMLEWKVVSFTIILFFAGMTIFSLAKD